MFRDLLRALLITGLALEASAQDRSKETSNKQTIQTAFDAWQKGTGSPFDLLTADATWTIVGNASVSKTYHSKREFLEFVITPFNQRLSKPLRPRVRSIHAEADTVIAMFDGEATAQDGKPYNNTYAWFMQMRAGKIIRVTAFFDTIAFTELWERVFPR